MMVGFRTGEITEVESGVLASGLFLAVVTVGVAAGLTDTLGLLLSVTAAVTALVAGGSFLVVYWRRGSRAGRQRR
ncbi:MAG: hypothetical protein KGN76_16600 [Acidobacteriota bacterium]|nr:hypothetical protein [Acidobacteriota bacterium]